MARFNSGFDIFWILLLSGAKVVEAEIIENYFGSSWVFLGICVFTAFIAILLGYSCIMDIRHWKRSINVRIQEKLPEATSSDFEQEISKFAPISSEKEEENLVTPQAHTLPVETTQLGTTEAEKNLSLEKHIKIIQAMYSSSGRELPPNFQQNAESRRVVSKSKPPVISLETISEVPDNGDEGSSRNQKTE